MHDEYVPLSLCHPRGPAGPSSRGGTMSRTKPRNGPSLTPELWAKVFAHLQELPKYASFGDDQVQKQHQAGIHQLKLVCKQFKNIYASHTGLVQRLYLCRDFSVTSLPSLLAWLQQGKSSVRMFSSPCEGQLVYAVLAGLAASQPSMRMIGCVLDAFSISLVASFTNLRKCAIWQLDEEHLDLAPLRVLPKLSYLILQGHFKHLHHLAALTRLNCIDADVLAVHELTPTLRHLEIEDSHLQDVHPQGFSACAALTQLVLKNPVVTDNNEDVYLSDDLSLVSTALLRLTRLHTLHLSSNAEDLPSLAWMSGLTSVKSLSISGSSSLDCVVQHASLLTQLTQFHISARPEYETSVLDVDMKWHRLQALQNLSIHGFTMNLGPGIAGLLQLQDLRQILFAGSRTLVEQDNQWLCALIYNLAKQRPQVQVCFGDGDLQDFFV